MPSDAADDNVLSTERRTLDRIDREPSASAPPLDLAPSSDVHCGRSIRIENGKFI